MTWPWIVAVVAAALIVGFTAGVLLMGLITNSARAVELDHLFLSRSAGL